MSRALAPPPSPALTAQTAARESRFARGATALLLVVLVCAAFGRSLRDGFAFDDFPYLVDNPTVRAPSALLDVFVDARTHTAGDVPRTYRPLRTLLFAGEYALFGEQPLPYHAVSLALHACVVLSVWRFARRIVTARLAAGLAALFACHPLLSEVVVSIKAQDDLVAALMVVLALLAASRAADGAHARRNEWLILVPYAIGLLAKEHVLALPVLLFLVPAVTGARRPGSAPLAAMVGLGLAFMALRSHALAHVTSVDPLGGAWLFPSSVTAIVVYVKLFVWPHPLSIDYPRLAAHALESWMMWSSIALQAAAGAWLWRSRNRTLRLGLVWFYVLLLPSLNPLGSVVVFAERFAYLPFVGLAFVVVGALEGLERERPKSVASLFAVACVALTPLSFARCADWRDTETLLRAALAADPSSVMARMGLRHMLVSQGRTQEAAALLGADFARVAPRSFAERSELVDRALIALQRGEYSRAEEVYRLVVGTTFVQWDDWLNYGTALTNLGERDRARRALGQALALQPGCAPALRMLGRIAIEAQEWGVAVARLREAALGEPQHALGTYFLVYATWQAEGDGAALAELDAARARGVEFGALIRSDSTRWESATGALRQRLEREAAGDP